ncbi:HNH endonuclease [Psychrobacter sp. NC44]|uniref:HNH endonuclease n=1 Tax=Psychrobacter sp. NC44 TaxID=2774130 RepID=UPI001919FD71|nr:hypothetical protein [Psychrobacter sp. NC44]
MMLSIKLPNFFNNNSLNALKSQMGVDRNTYGDFGNSQYKAAQIQLETTGIDIEDLSEITPLEDHTLSHNGKRIILYIRDISDWKDELKLPRFHVAHCSTLQTMIGNGKKKRYVVSQNENDLFHLNLINGKRITKVEHSLSICRNCLETIRWNSYSKSMPHEKRELCVSDFKVRDFFLKYPKSLVDKGGYSSQNSPLNQYSNDWSQISSQYRGSKKWTCEQCAVNLISHRRLLHTHHINSQKNENNYSNLMALCVDCHAKQPMHSHMYNLPDTNRHVKEISEIRKKQNIR